MVRVSLLASLAPPCAGHTTIANVTAAGIPLDLRLGSDVRLHEADHPTNTQLAGYQLPIPGNTTHAPPPPPSQTRLVVLGVGAMSWVVRGEYNGQTVAIKMLHHAVRTADGLAALRQEVSVLAGCSHPNIVRLLGAGLSADQEPPFLVLEYMAGGSLAQ